MKTDLNKISTIKDGEIKLFRNMSNILSLKYNVTFIGETHQQYVEYLSNQVSATAQREISDLWIIAFSPSQNQARMTFLQAKYHRGILDSTNRVFDGDYFQRELLSDRPLLTAIVGRRFNFPPDILLFSCCNSVGSYGVFYIDANNNIDMAYCIASSLTAQGNLPTMYSKYNMTWEIPYFQNVHYQLGNCKQCTELVSTFSIDTFTNELLGLEIGVELTLHPNILQFVKRVLRQVTPSTVINQFISSIDSIPPATTGATDSGFEGIPTNMLIINVDPLEPEKAQ